MYIVKENKGVETMIHLTDHSRMWNDRIHVALSANAETTITDDQLSPEIEGMSKAKMLVLTHIDDAPAVEAKVEEKPYLSKMRKKIIDPVINE